MFKLNSKLMTGAVLASALLAGCGGDSGGYASTGPTQPMDQTITAVADYIRNLIASNGENTEPIDINGLTLATDDTSEPAPVN